MIRTKKLENGIRLVSEKLPELQAASIGIWVAAGSAYENEKNSGVSHFIEHMFFKGTSSRGFRQIAEEMDNLGAQYNAFTGKEYTCFHAKALTNVFPNVCDVLFDMLTNSVFDEKELKKERKVIIEEMQMVEDTPDDIILDNLTEAVLFGSDVANNILGSKKSLKGINRDDILEYIDKQYTKDSIVISVCGNYDEKHLIAQINQAFSSFKDSKITERICSASYTPKYISRVKDINQSHIALGIPSLSKGDKNYYAQAIVNDVLGGSMSSRLFQNIREERGLCYTVFSSPLSYVNTGLLFIYSAVSLGKEADAIKGIGEELSKISLTEEEIENVKQRLKASYIFGLEKLDSRMLSMGKNLLLLGRTYSEKQTMAEIDAVTKKQVDKYCESICDIGKYSCVVISKDKLNVKKLING